MMFLELFFSATNYDSESFLQHLLMLQKLTFATFLLQKNVARNFAFFLTCCKAQCCKLFAEKIDVAKAYVANILANYQCCKHKIEKNVAKKITYGIGAVGLGRFRLVYSR